jgi:hypothetical protein
MSKMSKCKWYNINNKVVILVSSKEDNKSVIRFSNIVYKNGELKKNYQTLYHNNPCKFYKQFINSKKIVVDKPFNKIDGAYILQLHKEGKFTF